MAPGLQWLICPAHQQSELSPIQCGRDTKAAAGIQFYPGVHMKQGSPKSKGTGGLEQLKSEGICSGFKPGQWLVLELAKSVFISCLSFLLSSPVGVGQRASTGEQCRLCHHWGWDQDKIWPVLTDPSPASSQGQNHFYSLTVPTTVGFGVGLIQMWI